MRRVFRENRRDTCADPRIRLNREGVVLARGKLDYDRPIARRCAACGAVIETTLADLHAPCPACGRYPEAVA
jgi:Zn finger protein HypA/HybF involved in hydrogenase expression